MAEKSQAGGGAEGLEGRVSAGSVNDLTGPATVAPQQGSIEKMTIVGCVAWLMMNTPTHKHIFVSDLEWCAIPPVALDQCHLWRRQGLPVAFASWAYLNEATEARVRAGHLRLAPTDWNGGDRLWIIDFLCPFGGQQEAMLDLKNRVLAGKRVNMVQRGPDGGLAFVQWGV